MSVKWTPRPSHFTEFCVREINKNIDVAKTAYGSISLCALCVTSGCDFMLMPSLSV